MDAKELLKKIKESALSETDYDWDDEEHDQELLDEMDTFEVPVRVVFEGTVSVKANTQEGAEDVVLNNFGGILDHCENNMNDAIVDWDIDMHGETEIKGE